MLQILSIIKNRKILYYTRLFDNMHKLNVSVNSFTYKYGLDLFNEYVNISCYIFTDIYLFTHPGSRSMDVCTSRPYQLWGSFS